jgi:hypothetical protein
MGEFVMRAHIIEGGKVINTIEVEDLDFMPGLIDAALGGAIGDDYIDGTFVTPSTPVIIPQVVTMRQARLALLADGKLADVEPAIATLPSPDKEAAQIEWEYATDVQRDWPTLLALAPALNLTDSDLDALFIQAATL